MIHPIDRVRDAFNRAHAICIGRRAHDILPASYMSIPPNPEFDADLILTDAIEELAKLRAENAHLKSRERAIADALQTCDGGEYVNDILERVNALRARVAELERELDRWPALDCPCCGKKAARATFFEDGQATSCGCGGRVYADGDAFIRLDECESKECAEGSTALAPRAEVRP